MATAAKAWDRLLSFPTAARCRPAITHSLNSSRRRDGATDADSLDLVGCMHDAMRASTSPISVISRFSRPRPPVLPYRWSCATDPRLALNEHDLTVSFFARLPRAQQ